MRRRKRELTPADVKREKHVIVTNPSELTKEELVKEVEFLNQKIRQIANYIRRKPHSLKASICYQMTKPWMTEELKNEDRSQEEDIF